MAMTDKEKLCRLRTAGTALYFAGKWSCHRPVDEAALWEALRDALELEAGVSTSAGTHD
jgi:hypothetical protein